MLTTTTTQKSLLLEAQDLQRLYDPTHALKGVSLKAFRGEVLALVGPNGAGKTTLGNVLIGRERPDHGKLTYYFESEGTQEPDTLELGYFPGDSLFFKSLAIERVFYHAATRKGIMGQEAAEVTQYWLDRLGLTARRNLPLSSFSQGNQQKIQLAEAVLHEPCLIFLDEPFNGLDPVNQEWLISLIRELQASGMTFLISDHHMALLERIADRVLLMHQGRLVVQGTLPELRQRAQLGYRVRLRPLEPAPINLTALREHPAVRSVEQVASGEIRLLVRASAPRNEVLNFAKQHLRLAEIFAEPTSLHDIYITLFSVQSADQETLLPLAA